MSDTPETDKAWKAGIKMSAEESEDFLRQHAERLERERDEAREVAEYWRGISQGEKPWTSLPWESAASNFTEKEGDQIGPCKRPDLCLLDHGHIPCPVCPNKIR
jgi:hypothetical protein